MRSIVPRLLHDDLTRAAAVVPDRLAVVADDERATYRELHERAQRLARGLQERGVVRGDRVVVCLENGVAAVAAVYAAGFAGAVAVVVHAQTRDEKLRFLLEDCGAAAFVTDARGARAAAALADSLPALRAVVAVNEPAGDGAPAAAGTRLDAGAGAEGGTAAVVVTEADLAPPGAAPHAVPTIPLDLAALIYTSGSTGRPKGVMMTHQAMAFTLGSLVEYLRLEADDRILNVLPLAFDYGLYQALMAVRLGATLVLERSFGFPAQVVKRMQAERVTVLPGVPTVFAALLALHRRQPFDLPDVRRITNTAAHLPDEHVAQLRAICPDALVYRMYGLTECKRVCYLEPELADVRPGSVGRAIPGTEAFVLDEDGHRAPPGVAGMLHVRGPHVMLGYWNRPEETARMLVPGPYPGERMLRTQDLFKTDAEGLLYFVGRTDDIIKRGGEKVSPVEVENALHTIPGVREAAVVGVPDDLLGEAVRAFVVLDDGVAPDERAFRREALARLEPFLVPRDVRFVDELPKTDSGKVRKRDLSAFDPATTGPRRNPA